MKNAEIEPADSKEETKSSGAEKPHSKDNSVVDSSEVPDELSDEKNGSIHADNDSDKPEDCPCESVEAINR
jgi:hypothetical protein